jgi:hypothetical protein
MAGTTIKLAPDGREAMDRLARLFGRRNRRMSYSDVVVKAEQLIQREASRLSYGFDERTEVKHDT